MERLHFFHQAHVEKLDHATIDAFVQARTREVEGQDGNAGWRGPVVFGLELTDRPAGQLVNFECADDPAPVAGMEAGCRLGVDGA